MDGRKGADLRKMVVMRQALVCSHLVGGIATPGSLFQYRGSVFCHSPLKVVLMLMQCHRAIIIHPFIHPSELRI
jgi:hypothetical protein